MFIVFNYCKLEVIGTQSAVENKINFQLNLLKEIERRLQWNTAL
jgi:hypothetical protein